MPALRGRGRAARHGRQLDPGANDLQISAGAPRAADRADDVGAPVEAPVLVGRVVHGERRAEPDAVLRRERAEGHVQRMIGRQLDCAVTDLLERERAAALADPIALAAQLGVKRAFALRRSGWCLRGQLGRLPAARGSSPGVSSLSPPASRLLGASGRPALGLRRGVARPFCRRPAGAAGGRAPGPWTRASCRRWGRGAGPRRGCGRRRAGDRRGRVRHRRSPARPGRRGRRSAP